MRTSISTIFLSIIVLVFSASAFAAESARVFCNGGHGMNGTPGFNFGGSAPDGWKGFNPGGRGGDGQRGRDGGDATAPTNGSNGCSVSVLLEKHPTDAKKLRYSGTAGGNAVSGELDLSGKTSLELLALGGRGGDGARGADGQDGGRGGEGGDAGDNYFSSGDGGRGGDGGNGGSSTNGANGGNGGTIVLKLRRGQEELANLVHSSAAGGAGGTQPFAFVHGGRGGQGGQPGNNCYFGSDGYKCVSRGMQGSTGIDGHSPFGNPQAGTPGRAGTVSVQVID